MNAWHALALLMSGFAAWRLIHWDARIERDVEHLDKLFGAYPDHREIAHVYAWLVTIVYTGAAVYFTVKGTS